MSGPYLPDQQVVTVLGEDATVKGVLSDTNKLLIVLDSGHELIVDTTFVTIPVERMAEPKVRGQVVFDGDLTLWMRLEDGTWWDPAEGGNKKWDAITHPALAVPLDPDHLTEYGYVRAKDLSYTARELRDEAQQLCEKLTSLVEDFLGLIGEAP